MKKSQLKKEMDSTFSEMEELSDTISAMLKKAKHAPDSEQIVKDAQVLMDRWSAIAKGYVASSVKYHNSVYKDFPIEV